jgi:hypothetical protein
MNAWEFEMSFCLSFRQAPDQVRGRHRDPVSSWIEDLPGFGFSRRDDFKKLSDFTAKAAAELSHKEAGVRYKSPRKIPYK